MKSESTLCKGECLNSLQKYCFTCCVPCDSCRLDPNHIGWPKFFNVRSYPSSSSHLILIVNSTYCCFCSVLTFNRLESIVDEKPICSYCIVARWHWEAKNLHLMPCHSQFYRRCCESLGSSVIRVSDGKERIRKVLTYPLIRRPFGERAASDSSICTKFQLSPDVLDSCRHRWMNW